MKVIKKYDGNKTHKKDVLSTNSFYHKDLRKQKLLFFTLCKVGFQRVQKTGSCNRGFTFLNTLNGIVGVVSAADFVIQKE